MACRCCARCGPRRRATEADEDVARTALAPWLAGQGLELVWLACLGLEGVLLARGSDGAVRAGRFTLSPGAETRGVVSVTFEAA